MPCSRTSGNEGSTYADLPCRVDHIDEGVHYEDRHLFALGIVALVADALRAASSIISAVYFAMSL